MMTFDVATHIASGPLCESCIAGECYSAASCGLFGGILVDG